VNGPKAGWQRIAVIRDGECVETTPEERGLKSFTFTLKFSSMDEVFIRFVDKKYPEYAEAFVRMKYPERAGIPPALPLWREMFPFDKDDRMAEIAANAEVIEQRFRTELVRHLGVPMQFIEDKERS